MTPRTPAQGLAYLGSRGPSTIVLGLERMHAALERLGHPERSYPILQVAGTNGKGSTSALAAQCLVEHGLRTGRYTSPHLVRPNERFWISGSDIEDTVLGERVVEVVERLGEGADALTYFELGTLVALWHFSREKVQAAVLEVGLGGRLDATTAAPAAVTAVAQIALDHAEWLGHSLPEVAGEKAAIFRPGVPAVSSAQAPEAAQVIEARARAIGAPLRVEGRDFFAEPFALSPEAEEGMRYRSGGLRLEVPRLALRGRHQVANAGLALAAVEDFATGRFALRSDRLVQALARARWPGRLEELGQRPRFVVDGAHNPAGVEALVSALERLYPGQRPQLVFGVLADKDAAVMRARLFPICAAVHLSPLPSPRASPIEGSEAHARQLGIPVRVHADPSSAMEAAAREAGAEGLVVCAGSLVLVGAARVWAGG